MDKKIAVLFAGQGAQYVGMGKDIYDNSPAAKSVMDAYEREIPGMLKMCFGGAAEELNLTINAQPCLMSVGLAGAYALQEKGVVFAGAAGFSLGETAALVYCGVVGLQDGIRLVKRRAELMQRCAVASNGAMAAILGLSDNDAESLCRRFGVQAVNYNCPGQVVAAGAVGNIDALIAGAKQYQARVMKLKVSGAFHSSYMNEAAAGMAEYLQDVRLNPPAIQLYSNLTGEAVSTDTDPIRLREMISAQVNSPVKWTKIISHMVEDGFNDFVEVGAGKTLSGLVKKICPSANVVSADGYGALCEAASLYGR